MTDHAPAFPTSLPGASFPDFSPAPSSIRGRAAWGVASILLAALGTAADQPPLVSSAVALDAGVSAGERLRDGEGSLDGDWQLAEARLFLRPHLAVRVGLGVGASREGYHPDDLGVAPALPDDVTQAWARVPLAVMFHQRWGITMQGSFGSGVDDAASFADGRQWQIQGGPLYVHDDDLIIALMVNVSSRIGEDPTIFPFPSLYWRFHPDWKLTVVDEVDNLSHLVWTLNGQVSVGVRVDVRLREAALGTDQVLSDDHVATALQATWSPTASETCQITPFAGAVLARHLAVRARDGEELWSRSTRPAPLVGLNLRARF